MSPRKKAMLLRLAKTRSSKSRYCSESLDSDSDDFYIKESSTAQLIQAEEAPAERHNVSKDSIKKKAPLFLKPQKLVTIMATANSEEQIFTVHKELICSESPFFSAAFNGSFQEGTSQIMKLPEVEAEILGLLVNWLYTKEVYFVVEEEKDEKEAVVEAWTNSLISLAKLWLLAQRALIPDLQNDTIDKILAAGIPKSCVSRVTCGFVQWIYREDTTEGSELRAMACDLMSSRVDADDLKAYRDVCPHALLFDLVIEYNTHSTTIPDVKPSKYYVTTK